LLVYVALNSSMIVYGLLHDLRKSAWLTESKMRIICE